MPKTGSSAIQAFLKLNLDKLYEKGFLYPDPPEFNQAFQTSAGNAVTISELFKANHLDEITKYISNLMKSKKNIILSSESLMDILQLFPERFFTVMNQFNFRIICYVRRQDELLSSSYNQLIKNHDFTDKEVAFNILMPAIDFPEIFEKCLTYAEADRFILRPYEKQQFHEGSIFSDFLYCLGLNFSDELVLPDKIVNPSFDRKTLEFRKMLNFMEVDKDDNVRKYEINSLLAEYTVSRNKGKPFESENLLTSSERRQILDKFLPGNKKVAEVFLNRKDGRLFYDYEIKQMKNEEFDGLNIDEALEICEFILNKKYTNSKDVLIKILALGTVNAFFDGESLLYSDNSENQLIYKLTSLPTNYSQFVSKLEMKYGYLYIESNGEDPYFIIPEFNNKSNDILIKIELTAINNGILEIFYISDNAFFDTSHSVKRFLKKGYNQIALKINESAPITKLRLDPGNKEGIYIIHLFEVYSISRE